MNPFMKLDASPIFIVGAARSGTTWVNDIFAAHPHVASIRESWLFSRNNGLGTLLVDSHRWSESPQGLGRILEREKLIELIRQFSCEILSEAIGPNHRFLVEKSPSHLFTMSFINEIFPNAKFIHVIRDGRDVTVSVLAATKSWMPNWKKTFGASISTSAHSWNHAVKRAKRDGQKFGSRFMEIRYEKLHQDPFFGYRGLFDFSGIPYDDEILNYVYEKTDFSRNYKMNEVGFRRGGRIGDWRSRFNIADAWNFNRIAGETLASLGYVTSSSWWLGQIRRTRIK